MIIKLDSVDVFYEKSGSGHPLLLLHGSGLDHTMFDEITEKLKNHYTVYALDTRNHGQSSTVEEYTYEAMADDVYRFIEALNLGKVYLLGFSDGAVIALHVALRHLEVLERVAFLGLNLKPSDMRERSIQYYEKCFEETGSSRFRLVLDAPNLEPEALSSITIPTMLMAAERDMFRDGLFEELEAAFPQLVKSKIMMGHKHESYMVHSDLIYPDVVEFFG